MKKLILSLFLIISSTSVLASFSPSINLPGGGEVKPTKSVSIPLKGLVAGAMYNIICYVNATQSFTVVMLGSNFGKGEGEILSYNLNGKKGIQHQLNLGDNTALTVGKFTEPASASVIYANLDQDNSFTVNNCFAYPVIN
jgi:hypothetical protein